MSENNEEDAKVPALRPKFTRQIVTVTQADIDYGKANNSRACPNALAVKRCIPNVKNVAVDLATTRFTDKETGARYVFATPPPAQDLIGRVDKLHGPDTPAPEPVTFRLRTLFQVRPKSLIPRKTPATVKQRDDTNKPPNKGKAHVGGPVIIGGKPLPTYGTERRFGTTYYGTPIPEKEASPPFSSLVFGDESQ